MMIMIENCGDTAANFSPNPWHFPLHLEEEMAGAFGDFEQVKGEYDKAWLFFRW